VGLVVNDDEGTQAFTLFITLSSSVSYPLAATAGKSTFLGIVSTYPSTIASVQISPPSSSHWWRLQSVTFAR
jgi:hypothetical protein